MINALVPASTVEAETTTTDLPKLTLPFPSSTDTGVGKIAGKVEIFDEDE